MLRQKKVLLRIVLITSDNRRSLVVKHMADRQQRQRHTHVNVPQTRVPAKRRRTDVASRALSFAARRWNASLIGHYRSEILTPDSETEIRTTFLMVLTVRYRTFQNYDIALFRTPISHFSELPYRTFQNYD